jgi:hypothetical protein
MNRRTGPFEYYYRIRIEGCISSEWKEWFAGMEIATAGNQTLLTGALADAAALYGVLKALASLNLVLISVERMEVFYKTYCRAARPSRRYTRRNRND